MAMPCVVGGVDHLVVAHRAAGLDHRGGAGLDRRPAGRRRTGRTRRRRPPSPWSAARRAQLLRRVLGLARGDARRIDAAHLAGADADGGAVLGIDDGVRLHVLGDAEGEAQVGELGRRSARAWSRPSARMSSTTALSRDCTRKPPATDFTVSPAARGSGRPPVSSSRRFFFARDDRDRLVGRVGRDDHLGEDLGDRRARPRRRACG